MNKATLAFLVVLLGASTVYASDYVCGNEPRPQCANTVGMTAYHQSVEPGTPLGPLCFELAEAVTRSQRMFVQQVAQSHANGRCHLKVVGGLAVEMTQPEKDAVNTALQVIKDEDAAQAAEAADPECSKASQAQIDAFFQKKWDDPENTNDFKGDIDALTTNSAPAIRTTLTNVVQRMLGIVKKVAKCNRAMGG